MWVGAFGAKDGAKAIRGCMEICQMGYIFLVVKENIHLSKTQKIGKLVFLRG